MKTGEIIKETKYLYFKVTEKKAKTIVVGVFNKSQDDMIAEIEWYGPWRQYCFCPGIGTVWNDQCLEDSKEVVTRLNNNHKNPYTKKEFDYFFDPDGDGDPMDG